MTLLTSVLQQYINKKKLQNISHYKLSVYRKMKVKLKPIIILVILVHTIAACGVTEKYIKRNKEADSLRLTIVAFGNSVTAPRKTVKQVFAQRLPELLAQKGIAATIINSGVPGSHSGKLEDNDAHRAKHALERLQAQVLDHKPNLVIVDFGINDAAIDARKNAPRIPLEVFRKNMEYMVTQMQTNGSKVLLMTPNALNRGKDYSDRLLKYAEVVRELSKTYKTGLVDNLEKFYDYGRKNGLLLDSLLLDGMHPNDVGHKLMAETIVKEIEAMYQKELSKRK